MRQCQCCTEWFKPDQSFESLFRKQEVCQVCGYLVETPIQESVLPLEGNELHLHFFARRDHPALFHVLLNHIVEEGKIMVFFTGKHMLEDTVWRLLGAMLAPLHVYTPKKLTLDEMQHILD